MVATAVRFIARLWAGIARLITERDISRLWKSAPESERGIRLTMESRLPTVAELKAAFAALADGCALVLTVQKRFAQQARALVLLAGFIIHVDPQERKLAPPRTYSARTFHGLSQGLFRGHAKTTIDIVARKNGSAIRWLPPLPAITLPSGTIRRVALPLRYPGGKVRGATVCLPYIPMSRTIVSPFFGAGGIERFLAGRGQYVVACDNNPELINFFLRVQRDEKAVAGIVRQHLDAFVPLSALGKSQFYYGLQRACDDIADLDERAAAYFIINRCSFSGATFVGGFDPDVIKFNIRSVNHLAAADLRGYTFKCRDFRDTFAAHPGEFLLLDPPYWDVARPLYGTPNAPPFTITDHLELFDLLKDRSNWLLQYDRVEPVLTLYAGFPMVRVQWAYGMGRARDSNEVLILPRESG